jgi:hypothetical protein
VNGADIERITVAPAATARPGTMVIGRAMVEG